MTTPVIIRRFRDKGDLIAIFPTLAGTSDPTTCMSYQRVGQHGACDPAHLMRVTDPVDPKDYERIGLWAQLVVAGYDDLIHKQRLHRSYLEQRRRQLAEWTAERRDDLDNRSTT